MNQRKDEECMFMFLDKIIVNGVQDPGLTPFEEFLPRSAPLARVRLNPEKCSFFLDRLAADPKWQISLRGVYDSLRLLYLRFFNEEARMVELMELRTQWRSKLPYLPRWTTQRNLNKKTQDS